MSRRAAGRLFKVSASSAIRWMESLSTRGTYVAKPSGGDVRSRSIETHKDWLLALVAQEPDLTLEEIRGRLATGRSFKASVSMLWRFSVVTGSALKKRCMSPSRTGPRRRQRPVDLAQGAACARS
jgi:transposase